MKKILWFIFMALILSGDTKELYLSLATEVRREIDAQMVSVSKQITAELDKLQAGVSAYVESNAGLTEKQIIDNLTQIQKDGGGVFDDLARGMTGAITDKVFTISEDVFFAGIEDETTFDIGESQEMWQAMFVNTCPDCLALHGNIMTHREWVDTGGVPNERPTVCTIRGKCHCILVPADILPSKREMRKPISIQAAKIRKAEKKRGKTYAPSTKKTFLGQINNPESTVYDLRKIKKIT